MTYYKQFAAMFGLELDEEFSLIKSDGTKVDNDSYRITEDGIFYKKGKNDFWLSEPSLTLSSLLKGSYKVVPNPWKPKNGEQYWYYDSKNGAECSYWHGFNYDYYSWKTGNCFRTEEETKTKGKEIMEQIKKEYEEA